MEQPTGDQRWISLARRHLTEIAQYRAGHQRELARLQRIYQRPLPTGASPEEQVRQATEQARAHQALVHHYAQLAEAMLQRHQREEQALARWLEQELIRQN